MSLSAIEKNLYQSQETLEEHAPALANSRGNVEAAWEALDGLRTPGAFEVISSSMHLHEARVILQGIAEHLPKYEEQIHSYIHHAAELPPPLDPVEEALLTNSEPPRTYELVHPNMTVTPHALRSFLGAQSTIDRMVGEHASASNSEQFGLNELVLLQSIADQAVMQERFSQHDIGPSSGFQPGPTKTMLHRLEGMGLIEGRLKTDVGPRLRSPYMEYKLTVFGMEALGQLPDMSVQKLVQSRLDVSALLRAEGEKFRSLGARLEEVVALYSISHTASGWGEFYSPDIVEATGFNKDALDIMLLNFRKDGVLSKEKNTDDPSGPPYIYKLTPFGRKVIKQLK